MTQRRPPPPERILPDALLGGASRERFLSHYWQKRPLLVRGAFPDFRDPLTPEELAGLSCEDGVESRIVRERGGARPWEVTFGPHEESAFAKLPERGWTLLVQELNRHVEEAALLLERFTFLPNVRVDDVMVSYAARGGSVGPHLDSYDVFLIQGLGERRWRYDVAKTKDRHIVAGLDLKILRTFEPDADEVLRTGDMLYLPPGHAHWGVAVTPCLTYSVGFRSPSAAELWTEFAAHRATGPGADALLVDPPLAADADPGTIPEAMRARVRAMVRASDAPDETIDRWFASFATRLKPGHELPTPRRPLKPEALFARLAKGARVARSEEARFAHLPRGKRGLWLYVGGSEIEVPASAAALARLLCSARRFDGRELARRGAEPASRALTCRLFEMGALRLSPASAR